MKSTLERDWKKVKKSRAGNLPTGGSWRALGHEVVEGPNGPTIATCHLTTGRPQQRPVSEQIANARIMAAAPELLDAAFEAMATLDIISPGDHRKMKALSLLRAAIKKAGAE